MGESSRGLPPPDLIEDMNLARGEKMEVPKSICAVRLSIEHGARQVGKRDNEVGKWLVNASITISNSKVLSPFLASPFYLQR